MNRWFNWRNIARVGVFHGIINDSHASPYGVFLRNMIDFFFVHFIESIVNFLIVANRRRLIITPSDVSVAAFAVLILLNRLL